MLGKERDPRSVALHPSIVTHRSSLIQLCICVSLYLGSYGVIESDVCHSVQTLYTQCAIISTARHFEHSKQRLFGVQINHKNLKIHLTKK